MLKTLLFIGLFGTAAVIILKDNHINYITELVNKFEADCQNQIFDNIILPPLRNRDYPAVFIWSPLHRYNISVLCPIHDYPIRYLLWTKSNKRGSSRTPRLIYGRDQNVIFIQQLYTCSVGEHSYFSSDPFIMENAELQTQFTYFPFQKYHRSMYTHDLVQFIFTSVINGVSFHQMAETVASNHFCHYLKATGSGDMIKFKSDIIYSYPSADGMEGTFLDIFKRHEDFYKSNFLCPRFSISVDHTFKVGKPIGGFRKSDNVFVKENLKLFIVLTEEGSVIDWRLTKTQNECEIEPVLQGIRNRLNGEKLKFIFTDTCCGYQNIYKTFFPDAQIKLDLFHAVQWITKTLPNKRNPEALKFSKSFGMIFRKIEDQGDDRNMETATQNEILTNLDYFIDDNKGFITTLPDVNRGFYLKK